MFKDFKEWIKFWTSNLDPLPIFVLGIIVGFVLSGVLSIFK